MTRLIAIPLRFRTRPTIAWDRVCVLGVMFLLLLILLLLHGMVRDFPISFPKRYGLMTLREGKNREINPPSSQGNASECLPSVTKSFPFIFPWALFRAHKARESRAAGSSVGWDQGLDFYSPSQLRSTVHYLTLARNYRTAFGSPIQRQVLPSWRDIMTCERPRFPTGPSETH